MPRRIGCRVLMFALVFLGVACSSQPKGAEYFAGTAGSRRIYSVRMLVPLTGVVEGTMIVRVDGTADINGRTYSKSVITFDGIPGAGSEVSYGRLGADGIYSRKSTEPQAPETLEIPLPPDIGRKWSYVQGDLKMDLEISAIEDVDTVEKTYRQCLKVTGIGTKGRNPIKAVSYFAPKTGLVKMSMEGSGVLLEMKLKSE